jgi:predicted RNA-binding protein with TRAM domain
MVFNCFFSLQTFINEKHFVHVKIICGGKKEMNRGNGVAPVSEGEELDVMIESVGGKGDGVAKIKGFVLFVPKVKKGDNVRIRVTKVLQNVGFAEKIGEAKGRSEEKEIAPEPPKPEEVYEDTEEF